jgi:hypothetical protein
MDNIGRAGDLLLHQLGDMKEGRADFVISSVYWCLRHPEKRFSLFDKFGKPLHATGHQRWWRVIHGLDRRPQSCLPLLQIGNQVWWTVGSAVTDQVSPQDLTGRR